MPRQTQIYIPSVYIFEAGKNNCENIGDYIEKLKGDLMRYKAIEQVGGYDSKDEAIKKLADDTLVKEKEINNLKAMLEESSTKSKSDIEVLKDELLTTQIKLREINSYNKRLEHEIDARTKTILELNIHIAKLESAQIDREVIPIIHDAIPNEKLQKITAFLEIIQKLDTSEGMAKMPRILEEAQKISIDEATTNKYINELELSGDIFKPRPNVVKIVRHESA